MERERERLFVPFLIFNRERKGIAKKNKFLFVI